MSGRKKLPSLSWRDPGEILKVLRRFGFLPVRQPSSYIMLRNQEGVRIVVPRHDPVRKGLLMDILAEAPLAKEEFLEAL